MTIQKNPRIDFVRCPDCFGISADMMPLPHVLDDYYANYYSRVEKELITFSKPIRMAQMLMRWIKPEDSVARILDYGGGDGRIAVNLATLLVEQNPQRQITVDVVDYVDKKPLEVSPHVLVRYDRGLQDAKESADIVLASAILEHIPDYYAEMSKLWATLRPGGLFYTRTPYMSPFARIFKSLDMTYPAHVHDLGHAFWNRAAETQGVTVLASQPSIIETTLDSHFLRTVIAAVCKFPAHVLSMLNLPIVWPFYGGWQVIWKKSS
ncbi:MAG: methyltransferase domain-containing protein [Pseudomonadota bacterium]